MSLIQDALKRQQQEFGDAGTQQTPPAPGPEPPVTETMPVTQKLTTTAPPAVPTATTSPAMPPPLPAALRSSKPRMLMGGMVVAGCLVLVVGGLLVAKWTVKMNSKKQMTISRLASVMPIAKAEPDKVKSVENAVQPPARKKESVSSITKSSESHDATPSLQLATESKEPAVPEPQMGKPLSKKAPPAPLVWPTLKLTGILSGQSAGTGAARINNQMVYVDGQIDGVTLVEIRPDGVMLLYGGSTRFLKIGGVLY